MTTIPRIEDLPAVPDISLWDGDNPTDQVRHHWVHPDEWAELSDGRPVLELFQGVIGRLIETDDGDECLAVYAAARHLESLGWQIIREDDGKDWAEVTLTPPDGSY